MSHMGLRAENFLFLKKRNVPQTFPFVGIVNFATGESSKMKLAKPKPYVLLFGDPSLMVV